MKNLLLFCFVFLACLPAVQGQESSLVHTFERLKGYPNEVIFSPNGQHFLYYNGGRLLGWDKEFRELSLPYGEFSNINEKGFFVSMYTDAEYYGGKYICKGIRISLTNIISSKTLYQHDNEGSYYCERIKRIFSVSPDNKLIIAQNNDNMFLSYLEDVQQVQKFNTLNATDAFFTANQKQIVVVKEGEIQIFNVNRENALRTFTWHEKRIKRAFFIKNEAEIVSFDSHTIKWWDTQTGTCLKTIDISKAVEKVAKDVVITCLAVNNDGKYALTGTDDNTIRLWDLENLQCIGTFEGHTLSITALAFSPDNKFALSGSRDRSVKLWDLSKGITPKNEIVSIQKQPEKSTKKEPEPSKTEPDIAQNLPKARKKNEDAVAVVIGNQNYTKTKKVEYAINDARLMKRYLIETLGYKEGNILYQEDADLGTMQTIFGTKENREGKLANIVKSSSDVFVYYSGHGAPDMTGKERTAYFVPVECDPSFVAMGGYSLNTLYQNLSTLKVRNITVVLDACFSGEGIIDNISPVFIKPAKPHLRENFAVFASCEGEQVSCWHNEKQQGLFTYFFLKAIHNKNADANEDGTLTLQEIQQYIADKTKGVPYEARRLHNKMQNPQLWWNGKDRDFMRYDD